MPETGSSPNHDVGFREIFIPVWAERKRILAISLLAGAVTLGINFLLPKSYKVTATLLPETDRNKLNLTSQFAGLASLAGVNVGGSDISRLYPVILSSESVLTNVVEKKYVTERFKDSVDLITYFQLDDEPREKALDDALNTMKDVFSASMDNRTNVVTVTLEMREPRLAADVLNASLEELDTFLREKKATSATEQRKWIESRLIQVSAELRSAEEALKDFREKNRRVMDSPALLLVQERLARDVQVKSTIDVELLKQAELAKIEEIKQISTINVLDEGRPPVKKSGPRRATNAAIALIMAFVCASGYFAVRSMYGNRIAEYLRSFT